MDYKIAIKRGKKYWYAKIIASNGHVIFSTPTSQTYSSRAKVLQAVNTMVKWLEQNTFPVDILK